MSSYLIHTDDVHGDTVTISGAEAHHAVRVARRKIGESVRLIEGNGTGYDAEITDVTRDTLTCHITRRIDDAGEPRVRLTLAMALLKGSTFDTVVEKAVELGVSTIIPLESTNCIARDPSPKKHERWESLALSATKQCLRSRVPEITRPLTTAELTERIPNYTHTFVAWVHDDGNTLDADFADDADILLIIGPEGGFTDEEITQLTSAGARTITLGPRRLRAETAALTGITLVMNRAGEMLRPMDTVAVRSP
jgi:16S rRNA (uracil1498-N3)-methyltransferase